MSNILATLNLSKKQLKKLAKAAKQAAEDTDTDDEETSSEVEYLDYEFETDSEADHTHSDTDSDDDDTDSDTDSDDDDTDSDTDSDDDTDSESEDEDHKYTKKELNNTKLFLVRDIRDICKDMGLKKTGNKAELIARILKAQR